MSIDCIMRVKCESVRNKRKRILKEIRWKRRNEGVKYLGYIRNRCIILLNKRNMDR